MLSFDNEWFLSGLLVRDLLLNLLQICYKVADHVRRSVGHLDVLKCLLKQVLNHWIANADLHPRHLHKLRSFQGQLHRVPGPSLYPLLGFLVELISHTF